MSSPRVARRAPSSKRHRTHTARDTLGAAKQSRPLLFEHVGFNRNARRRAPLARNPDTRRATAWYPYLRLLQMGFAKPCRCRHAGALLPHRFSFSPVETGESSFLWHFPSGCPAQPLAGILPCGARTFLACDAYAAVWPTRMLYSSATPKSRYNFQPKGTVLFGYQVGES